MLKRKQVKIGKSDYKSFIEQNGYFVDKTLFIKEVIDNAYEVIVIPCPRRFGKTFNLSMLRYFFDISLKDTTALFEPYLIWKEETYYTKQQGKYPVIHLSLKGGKANSFEKSQQDIYNILRQVYQENRWLLEKNVLAKDERDEFLAIINKKADATAYDFSLRKLCEYLHRYYGQKAIVLLDEYDAPIHTGFQYGYYDKIIELMKSLLGNTFKDNIHLQKGVITGILRIAKESIFSDFNNPGVFTILSTVFDDKFGFTTKEVQEMLAYFELENQYESIKKWYDGYHFGKVKSIYNPWSIINYIAFSQDGFKPYWVNTSSDHLIKRSITDREADDIRASIGQLVNDGTIERFIDENIIFSDFDRDKEILWSLLVFCGYLSPVQRIEGKEYELKIPNYEIKTLFKEIIVEWFKVELKIRQATLRSMTKNLVNNRIDDFRKDFKKIMADTFSYFDINTEPERVYQAYVLGLLGMLADDYIIKSNRESGDGRYDILLLPKQNSNYGIIIEIKQLDKNAGSKRIQTELAAALNQITNNKYYKELITHQVTKRIELAMVFAGKEVHVEAN